MEEGIDQFGEVDGGGDRFRAGGGPFPGVDEHQFDIGREAHLAASAFPEGANGELAGSGSGHAVGRAGGTQSRAAILGGEFGFAAGDGRDHRHFGDVRQFLAEASEVVNMPEDLPHVDAEHLAIAKVVEGGAPVGPGRIERGGALGLELVAGFGGDEGIDFADQGEEVFVLHPEEIVPEEITHAEQAGEPLEDDRAFEVGHFVGPVGPQEQLREEVAKVQESRFGIGGVRQQVREMFDENGRGDQFALFDGVGDFLAAGIGDIDRVAGIAQGVAHLEAIDGDAGEGEGAR